MDFSTDIFDLIKEDKSFSLVGATIPSSKDVFFRAKQDEISQQYQSARIFMYETETDDWEHWGKVSNSEYQEAFQLMFKGIMFETALMFYNIIVDLSWVLCYVTIEYAHYQKGGGVGFTGMMSIEESYNILRKVENSVQNPNSEDNPFDYLKKMCPEFSEAVELVVDFWKQFGNSPIRQLYNFVKHKGKPQYSELAPHRGPKFMSLTMGAEGTQYPTDVNDVQKTISLYDSIQELKDFDDNELNPYIRKLFHLLETTLKPSQFIQ